MCCIASTGKPGGTTAPWLFALLFFVLLITLLVTLFDRYRPIYVAREQERWARLTEGVGRVLRFA